METQEDGADKAQRAVQSVEVGGRLLLALAQRLEPMSLKDLAASAALPPSRAHPYLVSYGRLGLVTQDNATGRYALGPAALQLGLTALHQYDPVRAAGPVAEALAADTGQAVAIAIWGNFGPTVIRMIDARQPLHVVMRAGTVMSMTTRIWAVSPAASELPVASKPVWALPLKLALSTKVPGSSINIGAALTT